MSPKRPSPLEEPPAASSSEEEVSDEEIDSEEEEESEEGEKTEQKQQHKKASSILPPAPSVDKKASKMPGTQPQSSSDDDDGSDSDHPPRGVADLNVKPIASKPMDDASKLKKPRSKSTAPAPSPTPTKSAAKQPVENIGGEGKNSKRLKKKVPEADGGAVKTEKEKKSGDDSKKPLFQRLWSEEDEIVILKGMIDYSSKAGADPVADLDAFHEFIKKSLHIDVTRTQLMDKMRRLKKKYENNAGKGEKGEDRTFSKPHEQNVYDLSKKVWGSQAHNGRVDQAKSAKRSQKKDKRFTPAEKEQLLASLRGPTNEPLKDTEEQNSGPSPVSNESILFNKSIVASGLDESFMMKEGLELIDSAKRSELEEKWRKLHVAETEIFLRRIELVREQTKLVLDTHKKK